HGEPGILLLRDQERRAGEIELPLGSASLPGEELPGGDRGGCHVRKVRARVGALKPERGAARGRSGREGGALRRTPLVPEPQPWVDTAGSAGAVGWLPSAGSPSARRGRPDRRPRGPSPSSAMSITSS